MKQTYSVPNQKVKKPQPIYVIKKQDFDRIFNYARTYMEFPNRQFGTFFTKEELIEALSSIKFDENEEALISKVMEMLNDHISHKLSVRGSALIFFYKSQVQWARKTKSLQQT